ncbi:MAG: hypothetical protein ACK40M_03035 [Flavobacteriales bacterium]
MNALKNIGYLAGKYFAQILVITLGLVVLMIGMKTDPETGFKQNNLFVLGGVALLLAGTISTLYVAEVINRMLHTIFLYVLLPIGVITYGYLDYKSIMDEVEYRERVAMVNRETQQRLKDIRDAQVEFRAMYNRYAPSFDSLRWFIQEGRAMVINRLGDVPDKLSEEQFKFLGYKEHPEKMISEVEAWKLAKAGLLPNFNRDTTYNSVMEKIFLSNKALANRDSDYKFSVDSLDVAPYSGGMKFTMETGMIKKNNIDVPVLLIVEPNPFDKDKPLTVGSLTDVTTNGNWGE